MRKYRNDLLCLAVIALAVGLYHHEALLGKGCYFHGDYAPQDIPYRYYFSEALRHGDLPLWTPEMDCGWPLYAEGQSGVFYPLNWLLCLRPLTYFFTLSLVLHVFLAGAGTFFLSRTLGVGPRGALLAGLCISFSPIYNLEEGCANFVCSSAWIPIVAAFFKLAFSRRSHRYLLLSATAFAVQLLAGHPYPTWYGLLTVLFLALGECWVSRGLLHRIASVLSRLALWGFIALGLGAIQLFPLARLVAHTERKEGIAEQLVGTGLKAVAYRSILSPNYFGTDRRNIEYVDVQEHQMLFLGITAVCLAPFGLWARPRRLTVLLLLMAVFGVLASLEGSSTFIPKLLALGPPANMFRNRASYIMLTILAVALLSGQGLHSLLDLRTPAAAEDQDRSRPSVRGVWALFVVVVLGSVALLFYQFAVREGYLPPPESQPPTEEMARYKLNLLLAGRRKDLMAAAVFIGLAWVTIAVYLASQVHRGKLGVLLLTQQLINVMCCGLPRPALIEPTFFERRPQALEAAGTTSEPVRTYSRWNRNPGDNSGNFSAPDLDHESFHLNADLVGYDLGLMHGVDFVNSFPGPLRITRYTRLESTIDHTGDTRLLGLLNVRYLFTTRDFSVRLPGLRLIQDQEVRVYENEHFLPRAFLVSRIIPATDEWNARSMVTGVSFLPGREAVVEDYDGGPLPPADPASAPGQAEIISHQRHRVEIRVESADDALLVLSDTYYPGWTATIDGEPARIYRTDYLFRGVRVPAGHHHVVFQYVDWPFRIGSATTLTTLAIVVLILLRGRKKRQPDLPVEPAGPAEATTGKTPESANRQAGSQTT